jgi:4'-phosphopantetheinyl transferase
VNERCEAEVRVSIRQSSGDRMRDRTAMVAAVAELLGVPPSTVSIAQECEDCGGDHGQPRVSLAAPHRTGHRPRASRAWVSLARARDFLAVAVSLAGPVGVDIEDVGAVAREPLDAFDEPEWRAIRESDDPARRMAEFWTAKEAILKADGRGLRCDPRDLSIRLPERGARGIPRLVRWAGASVTPREVHLRQFEPATGLVGAIAVVGPARATVDLRFRTGGEGTSRRPIDG